jgi:hypothetical protein
MDTQNRNHILDQAELRELLAPLSSATRPETGALTAISPAILRDAEPAPCNIYTKSTTNQPILIVAVGKIASDSVDTRGGWLARELYVATAEYGVYFEARRRALQLALDSKVMDATDCSTAIFGCCRDALTFANEFKNNGGLEYIFTFFQKLTQQLLSKRQLLATAARLSAYSEDLAIHSTNVGLFSILLSSAYLTSEADLHKLSAIAPAFFLHDFGRDEISFEHRSTDTHAETGAKLLLASGAFSELSVQVVQQHHLMRDPQNSDAEMRMNIFSKICRLVDEYDLRTHAAYLAGSKSPTYESLRAIATFLHDSVEKQLFRCFVQLFQHN